MVLLLAVLQCMHVHAQLELFFPSYTDQAQRPQLTYTYLGWFPIEIDVKGFQKISCNNGRIIKDTLFDFICIPERLGDCTVTVVSKENGKRKVYSKSIKVIEPPELDFDLISIALSDSGIIRYRIIDKKIGEDVTKEYFSGEFMVTLVYPDRRPDTFMFKNENGILDWTEFTSEGMKVNDTEKVKVRITLFGIITDLFADRIEKEFDVNGGSDKK
jgi:hypothetical protein